MLRIITHFSKSLSHSRSFEMTLSIPL